MKLLRTHRLWACGPLMTLALVLLAPALSRAQLLTHPTPSSSSPTSSPPASCPLGPAVVTLSGPAASPSACSAAADTLTNNPLYTQYNVTFVTPFACTSCVPLSGMPWPACVATLTATLQPLTLLQWYANAWANPVNGTYGYGAYMVRIYESNPTCSGDTATQLCADLLPASLRLMLGAQSCNLTSTPTTYHDSCGGYASAPATCGGGCAAPPAPAPYAPTPAVYPPSYR